MTRVLGLKLSVINGIGHIEIVLIIASTKYQTT